MRRGERLAAELLDAARFLPDERPAAVLSPRDQRRLGPAALAVWRFLVGRNTGAVEAQRWELWRLARRVVDPRTGVPVTGSTLDRALRRLDDAGLIRRARRRVERGGELGMTWDPVARVAVKVPRAPASPRWSSTLDLWAFGCVRRGRLIVPIAAIEWCATAPGRGGYRHGARRDPVKLTFDPSPPTTIATSRRELASQSDAPITLRERESRSVLPSEEHVHAPGGPAAEVFLGSRVEGERSAPRPLTSATRLASYASAAEARLGALSVELADGMRRIEARTGRRYDDARYAALRAAEDAAGYAHPLARLGKAGAP